MSANEPATANMKDWGMKKYENWGHLSTLDGGHGEDILDRADKDSLIVLKLLTRQLI